MFTKSYFDIGLAGSHAVLLHSISNFTTLTKFTKDQQISALLIKILRLTEVSNFKKSEAVSY